MNRPATPPVTGLAAPLAIYGESLAGEAAGASIATHIRFDDGSRRRAPIERYLARADDVDERALDRLRGPVLDVGCGPGRHLHALAARQIFSLGVDLSEMAVALARGHGANAVVASVFDELPGAGHWSSALLLDGNIGIGGRPARLLRRVRELLVADGRALVELAAPHHPTVETLARLEAGPRVSEWFAWAEVSAQDIDVVAATAGMRIVDRFADGDRWFAVLEVRS